jgi:hypothetical protein
MSRKFAAFVLAIYIYSSPSAGIVRVSVGFAELVVQPVVPAPLVQAVLEFRGAEQTNQHNFMSYLLYLPSNLHVNKANDCDKTQNQKQNQNDPQK